MSEYVQVKSICRLIQKRSSKAFERNRCSKASEELKIPYGTLFDWIKKEREVVIETGEARTASEAMSLAEEIQKLRKENKEHIKEIKRLIELNEFLDEASTFSQRGVGSRENRAIKVYSHKDRWRQK